MKVVLIQNVPGLGKIDEIKEVAEGYARNFLFAKNLAVPATNKALGDIESRQARKVKEYERDLKDQQILAGKIDGWEINITEKASVAGMLFAAVGAQKISDLLKKSGFVIEKNRIIMKPVKEAGEYKAKIKMRHGLEAEITIIVTAKT
jgi:large subunit ribosomal protein L9